METVTEPVDAKRQAMLERMAKVRAARGKNKEARQEDNPRKYPKRRYRKREYKELAKPVKKANSPIPAEGWLDGIGHMPYGCPSACNADRCVISGENVCQHPECGAPQAKYMTEEFAGVRARFNAAREELKRLDVEKAKRGG